MLGRAAAAQILGNSDQLVREKRQILPGGRPIAAFTPRSIAKMRAHMADQTVVLHFGHALAFRPCDRWSGGMTGLGSVFAKARLTVQRSFSAFAR